jgi:hypothetical protein
MVNQDVLMVSLSFQLPGIEGLGVGFLILRTIAFLSFSCRASLTMPASTRLVLGVEPGAGAVAHVNMRQRGGAAPPTFAGAVHGHGGCMLRLSECVGRGEDNSIGCSKCGVSAVCVAELARMKSRGRDDGCLDQRRSGCDHCQDLTSPDLDKDHVKDNGARFRRRERVQICLQKVESFLNL